MEWNMKIIVSSFLSGLVLANELKKRRIGKIRMVCRAKENGKVSKCGKPSIEWYAGGKPQYYCCGYIDKMTDELLPECKECRVHVSKAQEDLDAWNRRVCKQREIGKKQRPGI